MNKKQSEPLMFIDTAYKVSNQYTQSAYDSRYPKPKVEVLKVDEKPIDNNLLLKLDSIISLYNKDRPVVCEILSDNLYECIPYAKDNNSLYVKQNGENKQIKLSDISDIFIVRF